MSLRIKKPIIPHKHTSNHKASRVLEKKSDQNFVKGNEDDAVMGCAASKFGKRRIILIVLGLFFGALHAYHVSALYENDRHFSHLSNLEREMCFRSEMGLYYSFYKRIIYSESFLDGVFMLKADNITEYPDTVDSLSKFNIYPEVMIAGMFRVYQQLLQTLGWTGRNCYTVHRGGDYPPVESCTGLGDPLLFYIEIVWVFAGLTAFLLFTYGVHLSGSVMGGCFTIVSFFINHIESTRVQWTPPLRESFGYPMIVLHFLTVSITLQYHRKNSHDLPFNSKESMLSFSVLFSLLFWQFSQFIFVCEIAILVIMYAFGMIKRKVFLKIFSCIVTGFMAAVVGLMGNKLLTFSFLTAILLSCGLLLTTDYKVTQLAFSWKSFLRIIGCFGFAAVLKFSFPSTGSDSHILRIFLSKFFETLNDFHTLMYTCAPEFRGLPWSYFGALCGSLLIPLLIVVLLVLALSPLWRCAEHSSTAQSESSSKQFLINEPSIFFNVCLLIAFLMLAMMAMRLKLFLTPQMCILISLIASNAILKSIPVVGKKQIARTLLPVVGLAALLFYGSDNIRRQHDIEGEYSNYPLEDVLSWVNLRTKRSDVFAGPMPIMASIILSTGRPIVNHPYYEDQGMRDRTIQAYSVFSRKSASEAFEAIQRLGANHVVLEAHKCFDHLQPSEGCKMTNLWDVEDPQNAQRPALCPQLFSGDPSPFKRVFSNSEYVILYLDSSDDD